MINYSELLYLARMKDNHAIRSLLEAFEMQINFEVGAQTAKYNVPAYYRDDLVLEGQLCVMRAVEYFREDRDCRFSSFTNMIIRRRIQQVVRGLVQQWSNYQPYTLDAELDDKPAMTNLLRTNDMMSDPVYRMHFNEAWNRMDQTVQQLSSKEQEILHTWLEGGTYEMRSEKLGLTYRQYEGRLRRLRKKLFDAVWSEENNANSQEEI